MSTSGLGLQDEKDVCLARYNAPVRREGHWYVGVAIKRGVGDSRRAHLSFNAPGFGEGGQY